MDPCGIACAMGKVTGASASMCDAGCLLCLRGRRTASVAGDGFALGVANVLGQSDLLGAGPTPESPGIPTALLGSKNWSSKLKQLECRLGAGPTVWSPWLALPEIMALLFGKILSSVDHGASGMVAALGQK